MTEVVNFPTYKDTTDHEEYQRLNNAVADWVNELGFVAMVIVDGLLEGTQPTDEQVRQ